MKKLFFVLLIFYTSPIWSITVPLADSLPLSQEKMSNIMDIIYNEYVDHIGSDTLLRWAVGGITDHLDPFSSYIQPKAFERFKESTKGYFGGLGIEITLRDDYVTVIAPLEGTPADSAGIESGDKIATIKNTDTDIIQAKGLSIEEAVELLRGDVGSTVVIGIIREGDTVPFDLTLVREVIRVKSVNTRLFEDSIGYVRLSKFKEISSDEFVTALTKLEEDKIKSLVLDLRNNPGGLLNIVVEIASTLLNPGQIIVSTKGRRAELQKVYVSHNTPHSWKGPLVVLINRGSASGSEIIAGAIQDHKRGVLLGTRTFGKASVQNVRSLPDGTGLKITTAKYYTPLGRMIHNVGIEPDIEMPFKYPDYKKDAKGDNDSAPISIYHKNIKNDTLTANAHDTSTIDTHGTRIESISDVNDNQLKKALTFLKYYEILNDNPSDRRKEK